MAEIDIEVERRRVERHASAALRAVSGLPTAELRAHRLRVGDRVVSMATPYLTLDTHAATADPDELVSRGVADALGLLLRFSDIELHLELSPTNLLERLLFDVLEQLRCDALVPARLRGVRSNCNAAFDAWCLDARASRVDENRTAMLVYATTHIVRARLVGRTLPEDVNDLIETPRGHLGPVIGHALRELPRHIGDQRAFSEPALEIARLVAELAGADGDRDNATSSTIADVSIRHRLLIPLDWDTGDVNAAEAGAGQLGGGALIDDDPALDLGEIGDYRVFSRDYDTEVRGSSLFRPDKLSQLRRQLDAMAAAQAVSAPRLAQRLLDLLGVPVDDDWQFGQSEGVLDGRRLSQLVANPTTVDLFASRQLAITSHAVVSFLIDNSGSMKSQRFRAVAVLVDTFARALDLAGVSCEVLGFTTAAWSGGRPLADWRRAGEPDSPGRVNEAMHIVYKDAATPWRRSRSSIAALSDPRHFREGLDGEALAWAHNRLVRRPEKRKVLVFISDGSPTDAATSNTNRTGYLDDHLAGVAGLIERRREVELGAIGIGLDMAPYIRRCINLDLSGTLSLLHYRALEQLFGTQPIVA